MGKKRYYLAYGSNLNMEQMQYRCPGAVPLGTAELEGYRLLFKGSKTGSYLTIEKAEGYCVPVGVWSVTAEDEERLDHYEGFPHFYYKTELDITYMGLVSKKAHRVKAFVYIMQEDRPFGIPSHMYVSTCSQGYADFGFDKDTLATAYVFSKKEAMKQWGIK